MACPWSCACDPSLLPLSKLLAIQDHTWWNNFEWTGREGGGEGRSVLYITDVQLAAIWSKERPVFHRIVSTFLQLVVASPHNKMKKMLCSLLRNPCNVNFNKKRVNRSFLTKPFWSRWLAIGFILFCSWTLTSLSPYNQAKKKTPRIQPSWHTYTHTNEWDFGSGLSKVSGCRWKSPPTWLVSAGYSAWHFFMDDVF